MGLLALIPVIPTLCRLVYAGSKHPRGGSFLTCFANAGTSNLSKLAEGHFETHIQDSRAAAADIAWWVVLEVLIQGWLGRP
jgi:hypothetical protein